MLNLGQAILQKALRAGSARQGANTLAKEAAGGLGRTMEKTAMANASDTLTLSKALRDARALGGSAYADFRVAPDLPPPDARKTSVSLSYLIGDDAVFGYAKHGILPDGTMLPTLPGLNETLQTIEAVPQDKANSLVFFDGPQQNDATMRLLQGPQAAVQSALAPGVQEVQANNPKVLAETLRYALENDDAPNRYLHVMTHGYGPMGFGMDAIQTAPDGTLLPEAQRLFLMPVADMGAAMKSGLGGKKLDLTWFTSCYMSNLEAMSELHGLSKYALASENEFILKDGAMLEQPRMYEALLAQGKQPLDVALTLAKASGADVAVTPGLDEITDPAFKGYRAIAVVDVDRIDGVMSATDALAKALLSASPEDKAGILAAYDATPFMDGGSAPIRDLQAFADRLAGQVHDPKILSLLPQLRAAQKAALLYEAHTPGLEEHGLSIFMPARSDLTAQAEFLNGAYARTRFAQNTAWADFLKSLPPAEAAS